MPQSDEMQHASASEASHDTAEEVNPPTAGSEGKQQALPDNTSNVETAVLSPPAAPCSQEVDTTEARSSPRKAKTTSSRYRKKRVCVRWGEPGRMQDLAQAYYDVVTKYDSSSSTAGRMHRSIAKILNEKWGNTDDGGQVSTQTVSKQLNRLLSRVREQEVFLTQSGKRADEGPLPPRNPHLHQVYMTITQAWQSSGRRKPLIKPIDTSDDTSVQFDVLESMSQEQSTRRNRTSVHVPERAVGNTSSRTTSSCDSDPGTPSAETPRKRRRSGDSSGCPSSAKKRKVHSVADSQKLVDLTEKHIMLFEASATADQKHKDAILSVATSTLDVLKHLTVTFDKIAASL